jgi:nucleotide-binding universal stress UspA family protein
MQMSLTSILAAMGEFPHDDAVLTRALELTATHRAALTIVHIIDLSGHKQGPIWHSNLHREAARAAQGRIEAALTRHRANASKTVIRIEAGSPALRLIEICEVLRPDIAVMRAHLDDRLVARIVGSTTDRVIAAGCAPVLVVKRPVAGTYDRVLFATDGTDDASRALAFVAALLPDARLHLVQAVEIAPQLEEAMLRIGTDWATLKAHRHALTRSARDHLRALAATAAPRGTTRVLLGQPARTLLRATRSPKVNLIALGPGRASLIRRAFIGSVTRRLLRDAACDVLICHPSPTGGQPDQAASTSVAIEK